MVDFKRFKSFSIYSVVFLGSFVFFFLIMFPYNVLKESLLSNLKKSTGVVLSAEDLSPALLIGAQLENANFSLPGGDKALSLSKVKITVNPFYIFAGKLHIDLKVVDTHKGEISSSVNLGLFSLLRGLVDVTGAKMTMENFEVQSVVDMVFDHLSKGGGNPLLGSLFNEISVIGKLNSDISFNIDTTSPEKSSGKIGLEINQAQLKFRSSDFGIEDQKFTKAKISGKMINGRLEVDKDSGFLTNDLDIAVSGKFQIAKALSSSQLEMQIKFKLLQALKDKFGFLIDGITQKSAGGEITVQVRGPLNMISVTTL